MIRVLGIDPGLAQTGWGIVDYADCRYTHVCHGVIQTSSDADLSKRLESIYKEFEKILNIYKPAEAGIESIFFARNVLSAIPVAHAKGVIHLLCAQKNISAAEYTPLQIKQSIVGSGRAEKKQVQSLVKLLLKLEKIPEPDHASDALAAAICHCNNRGFINVK